MRPDFYEGIQFENDRHYNQYRDRTDDTSYRDYDTIRDSWRSNSNRPYDFDYGLRRPAYHSDYDSSRFDSSEREEAMRTGGWGEGFDVGTERSGHFGKGPKGWKRTDERIREEASEALYRAHDVDASEINLTVDDGIVTLSGTVDERGTKRTAERCVEQITGVEDVINQIRIRKSGGLATSMTSPLI